MYFLVSGGLGNLGGRLVERLLNEDHGVRVTTRRPLRSLPAWAKNWEIFQVSPHEATSWSEALKGIDFVFHLAASDASSAASAPTSAFKAGGESTWNLLEAVANSDNQPPVIKVSTFHVYGKNARGLITEATDPRPVHPYAVGHLFGEIVIRCFSDLNRVRALNVRLSNAFGRPIAYDAGKWSLVFNDLCMQAATSNTLRLNSAGHQKRNFITIEDTVRALLFLANHQSDWPNDRIIHVGSNLNWSIRDVAQRVAERCRALWERCPEIICADKGGTEELSDFIFDVSRLEQMGFVWQNEFAREIDDTLNACKKWGKGE